MSSPSFVLRVHFSDIKGEAQMTVHDIRLELVTYREAKAINIMAKTGHVTIKGAEWNERRPKAVSSLVNKVGGHCAKASNIRSWM